MTRNHWLLLAVGLVAGLIISGRYALLAQERGGTAPPNSSRLPRGSSTDGPKNDGAIAEPKAGVDPIVADGPSGQLSSDQRIPRSAARFRTHYYAPTVSPFPVRLR